MDTENFRLNQNSVEIFKQRTNLLPIACYETVLDQFHSFTPLHWHDDVEFILVTKGEVIFQINEEKIILRAGNGLFINSGCVHRIEKRSKLNCSYISLNVSPRFLVPEELFRGYVYPYIQATHLSYLYMASKEIWEKKIIEAIIKINQILQKKSPYFEIDIIIHLRIIWQNLISNNFHLEYKQKEIIKADRIKQMISWIHLHSEEKITLDDIARAGKVSRSECCRDFKRVLNITPLNYVIDYRIQRSLTLLQHSELNITEIAYQVGFNSPSYFIYKFRKMIKMTPLSYKKLKMCNI
ncbi:AraC family transcriptional regulator [Priestia megaterium]|uniref:AraC family transcriptional regulator n=1 Tax=Priestia megaterium TaxID=1404 RepID=UPI000BF8A8C2|nr:AraC family transcriptional regulator [Priestia megaterium]PFB04609.1 AraC family transcriptional regulator [Priestia megaterium]